MSLRVMEYDDGKKAYTSGDIGITLVDKEPVRVDEYEVPHEQSEQIVEDVINGESGVADDKIRQLEKEKSDTLNQTPTEEPEQT